MIPHQVYKKSVEFVARITPVTVFATAARRFAVVMADALIAAAEAI